jgi:hypothetical protein
MLHAWQQQHRERQLRWKDRDGLSFFAEEAGARRPHSTLPIANCETGDTRQQHEGVWCGVAEGGCGPSRLFPFGEWVPGATGTHGPRPTDKPCFAPVNNERASSGGSAGALSALSFFDEEAANGPHSHCPPRGVGPNDPTDKRVDQAGVLGSGSSGSRPWEMPPPAPRRSMFSKLPFSTPMRGDALPLTESRGPSCIAAHRLVPSKQSPEAQLHWEPRRSSASLPPPAK